MTLPELSGGPADESLHEAFLRVRGESYRAGVDRTLADFRIIIDAIFGPGVPFTALPQAARQLQAKAWDEGYAVGDSDAYGLAAETLDEDELTPNPYAPADQPVDTAHQHESWQLREGASGRTYCAACGQDVPTIPGTPTPANPELWV